MDTLVVCTRSKTPAEAGVLLGDCALVAYFYAFFLHTTINDKHLCDRD